MLAFTICGRMGLRRASRALQIGPRCMTSKESQKNLRPLQTQELPFDARLLKRSFSSTPALFQAEAVVDAVKDGVSSPVASNIVDISQVGSTASIESLAEGLSSDLITATGGVATLQDMGLGCYYTPAGWLQIALDSVYNTGLPWFGAIAVSTLVIRTIMIPLVVKAQVGTAQFTAHLPNIQALQVAISEARQSGNMLEVSKKSNELVVYMRENDVKFSRSFVPILIQAPIFMSFFFALRGLANLPVETMKTGGTLWFLDLTIPDPYYLLPLMTCGTVVAMFELGADGAMKADNSKFKYAIRAFPVIMFPMIMNFPSAVLCYWFTSNLFSLCQSLVMRNPAVKKYLGIPMPPKMANPGPPKSSKGFLGDMKESYRNIGISNEIANRERADEIRFREAGTGPVIKTYKKPPVKQKSVNK